MKDKPLSPELDKIEMLPTLGSAPNPGNTFDCITLQIDRASAHSDTVPIAVATGFVYFAIWGTLVFSRALERLERADREVGSMEPPEGA